jgi:ABC-type transport system involved in multi-copper enzyme maturation permease subunit
MNSINKIWINASLEIKIILRSWFFRIFAGLSIILLFLVNLIFFSNVTGIPRIFQGISSFFPYANINLLNIVQSAILVFFATDIIRRDNKLNTNEVFYIRSMTNAEYLFGKTFGLFIVFFVLNLIVLLMSAIYQLIFPDINFTFAPYFYYLFLMSLPSIIFVIGLSFLCMHLLKNQAITIILLLGYVAAVLFYLSEKLYHIFDFMPTNLPLIYSDFVGVTGINEILLQRGLYLFLGLIFFLLTILWFKRLPQSKMVKQISIVTIGILSVLSLVFGYTYISNQLDTEAFRSQIIAINEENKTEPTVTMLKCILDLNHVDEKIEATANIAFSNPTRNDLGKYLFSLNPGLIVEKIEGGNSNYQFDQNKHILSVTPANPLKPNSADSVTITYSGMIDDRYCYLDISDEQLNEKFHIWMYIIDKNYSFVTSDFVLLTPESNWYPIAGLPYGTNFPESRHKDFVDFKLNVNTTENLTAVSQGNVEKLNDGNFIFSPENKLPHLSLVIAPYQQRSISVDSMEFSLYTLPEHNYFESYFTQESDTLSSVIREAKQEIENKIGLEYPFSRLNIVEVPIQFYSYNRMWTVSTSRVQPEMVLLPENGSYLAGTDFRFFQRINERQSERGNETLTDLEKEARMFKRFVDFTFLGKGSRNRFGGELMQEQPSHNLFPNFYTYYVNFHSESLPLFNMALESYFNDKTNVGGRVSSWFNSDLTTGEKISRKLNGNSLKELLQDSLKTELMSDIIKTKGAQLIKIIQSNVDSDELHKFFCNMIKNNQYKSSDLSDITKGLENQFGLDLIPYIDDWFSGTKIPGFLIRDIELFKVLDGDRIRYQVLYKISNPEEVVGLTDVRFRYGERRRFDDQRNSLETVRVVKLEPGETKEVGIVLDEEPSIIYMNPMIAINIPLAFADRFNVADLKENYKPFNSERILDEDLNTKLVNEIVVDNEDDLFQILSKAQQSFLKKLIYGENIIEENNFKRYQFWDPAENWELLKSTGFYGEYVHSAYYIRAGQGDKKAQWEAELPESGNYSVYTYVINKHSFGRKNFFEDHIKDIQYIVHHDDGEDEVSMDFVKAELGWNLLGSYYFSQGKAKVEITDKTGGNLVVADAVKWVRE